MWNSIFIHAINAMHAPLKQKRISKIKQPRWMSSNILNKLNVKQKKTNNDVDWEHRVARNPVVIT